MDISNNSSHTHLAGATVTATEARHELFNNPITYEIVLMIAVVFFALFLLGTMRCLLSCIAPDGYFDKEEEYDEEAQLWDANLTEDDDLLSDKAGGRRLKYGTFSVNNGTWYNADGTELSYDDWIESVYDPLD